MLNDEWANWAVGGCGYNYRLMHGPGDNSLPYVLPIGTQVVLRTSSQQSAGAVGVIVSSPVDAGHAYRVRLADGRELSAKRGDLVVLRHFQREENALVVPAPAVDYMPYVIYCCVIGSRAYGLDHADSDIDRRGIFLPPAERHWSLTGVPEQIENEATQECYWELSKFLILALKANPNVLECLHTPLVEEATPVAREMLEMRAVFVTKLVYQTYNGYVLSQFKKLSADLRNKGAVKWKHVMHLIRLLLSGVAALRTGIVPVRVEEHREKLLAIRGGQMPWEEVDRWRLAMHEEFDRAYAATTLPERPDYARVNDFLVRARRSMT